MRGPKGGCNGFTKGIAPDPQDSQRTPCLATCTERPVEVEGGADQGQVGEGLGEVAQRLAAGTDLLGVEPYVVGVAQHLLKDEPGLVEQACARERFDEPESAQAERPLVPFKAVRRLLDVVAVHEAV